MRLVFENSNGGIFLIEPLGGRAWCCTCWIQGVLHNLANGAAKPAGLRKSLLLCAFTNRMAAAMETYCFAFSTALSGG
ncbi:hypothetical protein ASD54_13210 [Rhizobium sp. Root149]|nr:hypothetical protein ASD54_13210 [Rhizobium sp. Root149]